VSYENEYLLLDCIFFLLILNVNFEIKVFLFNNFKFQNNTNEDNLNYINSLLSNDNKHDLD